MIIKHALRLGGSPVLPVYLREYANLIDAGLSRPYTVHTDASQVLYAEVEDKIVGGIVFNLSKDNSSCWIVMSFVIEAYRKQKINTQLYEALEQRLRNQGITRVESNVHVDNKIMQNAAFKRGMMPSFLRMSKDLT